jgi:hypothetical protein
MTLSSQRCRYVAGALLASTVALAPSIARADPVDSAIKRYVSRTATMSCDGLEVFDFLLESAAVIGEWCREQNDQLGPKGCGVGAPLCVKELVESELPGGSLTMGLSATAGVGSSNSSGSSIARSGYVWSGGSASGTSGPDWTGSSDFTYVELTLSVGVEIPLGSRQLRKVTCVNPLDHDYVRMLAENVVLNNEHLKTLSAACRLRRD